MDQRNKRLVPEVDQMLKVEGLWHTERLKWWFRGIRTKYSTYSDGWAEQSSDNMVTFIPFIVDKCTGLSCDFI